MPSTSKFYFIYIYVCRAELLSSEWVLIPGVTDVRYPTWALRTSARVTNLATSPGCIYFKLRVLLKLTYLVYVV